MENSYFNRPLTKTNRNARTVSSNPITTEISTGNSALMDNIKDDIQQLGFSIVQHFFTNKYIEEIIEQLDRHRALQYDKQELSDFNLINFIPFIHTLAHSRQLTFLVKQVLGDNAIPINAFVLDKTQDNNWKLDWHQDLKIAVKAKIETSGYSNWTIESGIHHAVAPKEVLEKKLSVRIHLDHCFIDNGALLVAPKSHKSGILQDKAEIEKIISDETIHCEVEKGGLVLMAPLLLHKSPYSTTNKKRRVLQIDYTGIELSNGLKWHN